MIDKLSEFIINKANSIDPDWESGELSIIATPSLNKGIEGEGGFKDKSGNYYPKAIIYRPVLDLLITYFIERNKTERINRIDIKLSDKQIISVKEYWDQSVQDKFDKNLPPSKRGKIKAWYLDTTS